MALAELIGGSITSVFDEVKEPDGTVYISAEPTFDQIKIDAVANFVNSPIVAEFTYHDYGVNKPNKSFAFTDRLLEDRRNGMSFEPGFGGMYNRLKQVLGKK